MSSKAKSKKPTQEDEDPDVDDPDVDDPDVDDSAPVPKPSKKKDAAASAPPKKKAKVAAAAAAAAAAAEAEEEEEEQAVEGEETAELTEEEKDKQKKALSKKRKKAKLVAYRSLSQKAGYVDTGDGIHPTTNDCLCSLLSEADAKRLMRFVPATPGSAGFNSNEFMQRLDLFKEGVPSSAARETQARCDAIMRSAMNQAVLRSVEAGKKTVSASTMASVLRQYAANMEFTAIVPPIGLVRFAQDNGILNPSSENELKKRGEEKKEQAANKKAYNDFVDWKEKQKADKRKKKEEAQEAARAVVTSA